MMRCACMYMACMLGNMCLELHAFFFVATRKIAIDITHIIAFTSYAWQLERSGLRFFFRSCLHTILSMRLRMSEFVLCYNV